jgi:cytochrome c biogenesis protein CcmG/thiol:disulfide interchange protein DsbE
MAEAVSPPPARRRALLFLLPLLLFAVVGVFLAIGLTRDPSTLPSALIGKPAPAFALPPIDGRDDHGFGRADLGGQPMLVNVFASWCVPCRIEHPVVSRLAEQGVVVQGINFKDKPEDAKAWLARHGDPYAAIATDRDGRVGIDFGVYGVPETFVIDKAGVIRFKQIGPITPDVLRDKLLPLLKQLNA